MATYARGGGIFNNDFTANLPRNLPVKNCKSVKIWQNYGHGFPPPCTTPIIVIMQICMKLTVHCSDIQFVLCNRPTWRPDKTVKTRSAWGAISTGQGTSWWRTGAATLRLAINDKQAAPAAITMVYGWRTHGASQPSLTLPLSSDQRSRTRVTTVTIERRPEHFTLHWTHRAIYDATPTWAYNACK